MTNLPLIRELPKTALDPLRWAAALRPAGRHGLFRQRARHMKPSGAIPSSWRIPSTG
jgi:hypothetical protein